MPRKSPWGRWHESWCAIFRGKSCDCDDDGGHREPRRRLPPLAEVVRLLRSGNGNWKMRSPRTH